MNSEGAKNNKIKSLIHSNWSWLLAMTITAVFMLAIMIVGHIRPFGGNSFTMVDSMHQYVPFYSEFQYKLKHFGNLEYTWNIGLGQSFLPLMLYYMASPFNLFLFFVRQKDVISVMCVLTALKIILSAGTFGFFLTRNRDKLVNNGLITAFAVAYALNNYICGYMWNLMWLDTIMILPIIILGYEKFMKGESPAMYILALFYALYCNYYIAFMVCIFLCLWFLAGSHESFKKFITDGLKFSGASILAAMMSAFSLMVSYLGIMRTSTAGRGLPEHKWYGPFTDILKKHFFLSEPVTMNNFDGDANLYCGIFAVVLLMFFIFSDRIKIAEKIRKVLLLGVFVVSMNESIMNFVWHGFHDQYGIPNRFSFLYIFTLLFIGYETVVRLKEQKVYQVVLASILALGVFPAIYFTAPIEGDVPAYAMLITSEMLVIIYCALSIMRARDLITFKTVSIVMAIVMILEITTNASFGFAQNGFADAAYYSEGLAEIEEARADLQKYKKLNDTGYYREELVTGKMLNENTYHNLRSIGTFCSTVPGDTVDTMARLGFYTGANEYLYKGNTPMTNDIFGVRYIYTVEGNYNNYALDYDLVYDKEDVKIYENKSALPPVYAVNSSIMEWDPSNYNAEANLNDMAELMNKTPYIYENMLAYYLVNGEGCKAQMSEDNPNLLTYKDGTGDTISITINFNPPDDGRYFINIRGNAMKNIDYYKNGERQASGRYFTQMIDLGELSIEDDVKLVMQFGENYSRSGSLNVYLSRLDQEHLNEFRQKLDENKMQVTYAGDTRIEGTIDVAPGEMLFTTIPYSDGWKIYDNGEEVETETIMNSFLGARLVPGRHNIVMKYRTPGLAPAWIVTILGWITFALILILGRRKDKSSEEDGEEENNDETEASEVENQVE